MPEMSLAPVAEQLSGLLGSEVKNALDCIGPEAEEAVNSQIERFLKHLAYFQNLVLKSLSKLDTKEEIDSSILGAVDAMSPMPI